MSGLITTNSSIYQTADGIQGQFYNSGTTQISELWETSYAMFLDYYTNMYLKPCSLTGATNTTVLALDLSRAKNFGFINCYGPITAYDSSFVVQKVLEQFQEKNFVVIV